MITSLDNKTVKQLTKLHQKKYRDDSFLLCDPSLIEEAYKSGHLKMLVYCGEKPFEFENCLEVSKEVLDKIAKRDDLDYLGVSSLIEDNDDYSDRIVILDHLQDPLNIGRIMEVCDLFGFDSLILSENCADIYNEKCLDNCKGNLYKLKIAHKELLSEIKLLQDKGYTVYATGLRNNTRELYEVKKKDRIAVILGNEGSGVREEVMDICDEIIKIDMVNIDSLNVGMAASIILYYFNSI
ncbi:MAG: RNA methyltransferase [Erysipelotrichaceae bacterium]|nr:RNA methyltransferase [Erysipelotrichaceae bacterium]